MVNAIFSNPAFRMETLTASILQVPFIPFQAGALGIFEADGINTLSLDLEYDSVSLMLIPYTERGAPEPNYRKAGRTMETLRVPHFPLKDTIHPEDFQDVREFGTPNQLRTVQSVVNDRMTGMAYSHDLTREFQMAGALKGVIYDSDGTTVKYNLFDKFGVTQDVVDFELDDANADLKLKCFAVSRLIEKALGAKPQGLIIKAFCGDDWFDAFTTHPSVKDAYQRWSDANGQVGAFLRDDQRTGFKFGGIYFENYTGAIGGVNFIAPAEAHFFPIGVPKLFQTRFSPGNFMSTANTKGLPRYARIDPLDGDRGAVLRTESNVLSYCTRPKCLVKGT